MRQTTIWVDHHKAYIFEYLKDGIHERTMEPQGHHEKITKEDLRTFYHEIAKTLSGSERILVVGPGTAKEEFKNHCEEHHRQVNKAIIQVQTMKDHPTPEQILKVSNAFFRNDQLWNGV
jgi:stalled ribosome rescue protein Dom34